jgi:hypothetical protein
MKKEKKGSERDEKAISPKAMHVQLFKDHIKEIFPPLRSLIIIQLFSFSPRRPSMNNARSPQRGLNSCEIIAFFLLSNPACRNLR